MSIEDDLRSTLSNRAARPDFRSDLLDRVRDGVHRDRRRRTLILTAAAVVTAVAIATPVVFLRGGNSPGPTITTTVTVSPTPSPTASASASLQWTRPDFAQLTFPLTPTWTPKGLGTPAVGKVGTNALLQYEPAKGGNLEVQVGPVPGEWGNEGEENHRAKVGSASATVRTSPTYDGATGPRDRYVGVRWLLPDKRWVQVTSWGPRTEDDILRYARGLQPRTLSGKLPFTFAEVPRGLQVQHVTKSYMCMAPPIEPAVQDGRGVCACLETELGEGMTTTVGGRPSIMRSDGSVAVDLGGSRVLVVYTDPDLFPMDVPELIRLAEGTTPR